MRKLLLLAWLLMTLAGCAGLGAAPAANNSAAEGVVRKWVDAYNKADGTALMALLSPDVKLLPLNGKTFETGNSVRDLFYGDFPYGVQIRMENVQVTGNTVASDVTLWSAKKGAFPDTPVRYTWVVNGDKISEIQIKPRQ